MSVDLLAMSADWVADVATALSRTVAEWITAPWFAPLVIALLTVQSRKYMHGFLAVFLGIVLGILTREQAVMTILLILLGYFANIGYYTLFSSHISELYTPPLDRRAIDRYARAMSRLRGGGRDE